MLFVHTYYYATCRKILQYRSFRMATKRQQVSQPQKHQQIQGMYLP